MNINVIKTFSLLAGLAGLMVLVGQLVGGRSGAVIGLVLGLVMVGGSYWFSGTLAVRASGAHEVDEAQAPELYAMVRELAQRAELPMPKVFVSPSSQPNAFASGRNHKHAVVCVTQGLVQVLDQREIRGVVAHELAHIAHRDILIGSVAAAIATGIQAVAQMAMFASIFGGGNSDDDDRPNPIALLLLMLLAPMAAGIIQMALSRSREFEADRFGAEVSGDPEGLASALLKIEHMARRVPMQVNPQQATAYIVNPLTGRTANFANLFRTHPETAQRVARLRELRVARPIAV